MQVQLIKNTNINGDAKLIENDKCLTLKNMQFYIKATLFSCYSPGNIFKLPEVSVQWLSLLCLDN